MRYRIRVETTNRHVHVSVWDDTDLDEMYSTLQFPDLTHLSIIDDGGRRIHFNPAHVVAVTIETEEET